MLPEPMVGPIGSPPPGRWNPVQIWTSTPFKNNSPVSDLASFDHPKDPAAAVALAHISHTLITWSQSSVQPYDDVYNSSLSFDTSPFADYANRGTHHCTHAHVPRSKLQPCPRFHHPNAYTYTWCRCNPRLPSKPERTHTYNHSQSFMDLPMCKWSRCIRPITYPSAQSIPRRICDRG